MYRSGKWAREILATQDAEGKWGNFHSLAQPTRGKALSTEQALRRLERLGFTAQDDCIRRALVYMHACLVGEKAIPDPVEKVQHWDIFTRMLLATWIRRFTPDDPAANLVAEQWAAVVTAAFAGGAFSQHACDTAYQRVFGVAPKRPVALAAFYPVSLTAGLLDPATEEAFVAHLLQNGIYYVYDRPLCTLPDDFQSKAASSFLAAIELLVPHIHDRRQLAFVADWLEAHRSGSVWDMGSAADDGIALPLSDSWRSVTAREADCTARIGRLLPLLQRA